MATIRIRTQDETDVEVTPDFCFQKAAEALTGYLDGLARGGNHETAREWRELGMAIHALTAAA